MSTLEAELLQAAKRADIAAWRHDRDGAVDEYDEAVDESRALRARAARVRELEADLKKRAQHGKRWSRQCAVHDRAIIAALAGPLNPDSAGGTR